MVEEHFAEGGPVTFVNLRTWEREFWGVHTVTSVLNYEVETEEREGRCGRRPQVDYTMSAHFECDILYCVPVEAQKNDTGERHASVDRLSISSELWRNEKIRQCWAAS